MKRRASKAFQLDYALHDSAVTNGALQLVERKWLRRLGDEIWLMLTGLTTRVLCLMNEFASSFVVGGKVRFKLNRARPTDVFILPLSFAFFFS